MAFIGRQTVNNIKQEIDCRATRCKQRLAKQAPSLVYEYVITSTQKQLAVNYSETCLLQPPNGILLCLLELI